MESQGTGDRLQELKNQLSRLNTEELFKIVSQKCFHKCVVYPSSELSSKEQKCLCSCVDRFIDAYNAAGQTYLSRVQKDNSANY